MSRYKDHRGPRRRGFDDDFAPPERDFGGRPSYPPRASPSAAPSTGPVTDATVKWFNAEKGFGFVELAGGSEAFLHIRPLEAAGHSSVSEGAKLKVRVGQGQKGAQVTEVLEVDATSAAPPRRPARAPRFEAEGPTEERTGVVKWYNPDKGFGFIALDSGGKDVFVHATTLERSGVTTLAEGQRVVIQVAQSQKGLEARSLQLG